MTNCKIWLLLPFLVTMFSCSQEDTLFSEVASSQSGVHFVNQVEEDSLFNVLEYMNIYTGAGVAAGDINNDGLTDLYFSANRGGGKLFLNKGNFTFEDVTAKSRLINDRWETGVSMTDVNQDGWMDIYVNVSGSSKFGKLANLLYINQKDGTFSEEASRYGIADERLTMNSSFFDYDKDGDLDLFLATNAADEMLSGINSITDRKLNGESSGTDILYRNNGNGTFTDVSASAGILIEGYSLGAGISDVNNDGWPDIYVSNDFLSNDILYINNGNGTFSDKIGEYLKHTSFASMGNDIADFNNDGLTDIYVLDMLPEDNYRKKMIMPAASFDKFQLSVSRGYSPQYSRNTLQLNNGNGTFSEIAFLSGVSSTDWSWSALWADYDNDGDKDLMVTNGFYRDLGNLDYIHYQARMNNPMGKQDAKREAKLKAIRELAQIPLHDYLFENNGDLSFTKRSEEWGFKKPGFSNGAAYADLDNDGDLDLVINQFNSESKIYRNNASKNNQGYVRIRLEGNVPNREGIGAKIYLYQAGQIQFNEFYTSRGYESSVEPFVHFGTGNLKTVDSIVVIWPDGKREKKVHIAVNTLVTFTQKEATEIHHREPVINKKYTEISHELGIDYVHVENEFVDFKVQPLLPHMHSQSGPGIAVGDVNNDGLEDFYIGGASGSAKSLFLQQKNNQFSKTNFSEHIDNEDMGVLMFDADNDNDDDLYVVSGGSEHKEGSEAQQDRLYINDGKGNFSWAPSSLPDTKSSGSCVVAADMDHDGDLDLFIGGRVIPGKYPLTPKSYLLRNDSQNGQCVFTKVVNAALENSGMVTSALWTDINNDGWHDLLVAGEFMPVTLFSNVNGTLVKDEKSNGLEHSSGWWNSLAAADVDQDGDMDYFAGNLGLNSRHKASKEEPLCIYAKDYDKNGLIDPVMCYYVDGKNYLYPTRDEMIRQINPMRGRFKTYESYAAVTFEASFTKEEVNDAFVVKSETFHSVYIENRGNGKFRMHALPRIAQTSPVFGMMPGDYNNDGKIDILIAGNSYATEASTGRYDAMQATLLAGDGSGNFTVDKKSIAGVIADKNVKSIAEILMADGKKLLLVGNNNNRLEAYRDTSSAGKVLSPNRNDVYALVKTKSGKTYRHEFYYGNNYLTGSSRKLTLPADVLSVDIYDNKGRRRNEKI